MIEWKDIELSDKPEIEEKICASGCHGADYGFANLYIWRKAYRPKIAFCGSRLLVGMPQWKVYAYPKGDGDPVPSIELLLREAHERGEKLRIRGLTDKTLEEFLPLYGDRFEIVEDRDNADYIYMTEKLCELAGRKLSSKRNHIKHFERNGPWEFHRITAHSCECINSCSDTAQNGEYRASSIDEARAFVAEFYKEKDDPGLADEATAMLDPSGRKEVLDTIRMLNRSKGITVIWITHFMEEAALADRVLVVTDGSVRLDGTPAEVFGHVDAMREMHLDVPHMTALADELRREGLPIRDGVLTVDDLVQEVEKAICPLKSAT